MSGLPYDHAKTLGFRKLPVENRWCVHSYYTLNPYAPDGSGRIAVAGCDLATRQTEVIVLDQDGHIQNRIPGPQAYESFWHTGLWQSWDRDGKHMFFQDGNLTDPVVARVNLATGDIKRMDGGMEGCLGAPVVAGQLGMLYAAGYGTCVYNPSISPVPFEERSRHGLYLHDLTTGSSKLVLSTEAALESHPDRDRLKKLDADMRKRLGGNEGLTLMLYCVRWNRQGTRLLFYFGNHCVVKDRGEPRLSYVFTADKNMKDIRLAMDLSEPRRGVHWGWHPDGEHLLGYGPDPLTPGESCLVEVLYNGENCRRLSRHHSGGHPSISPADPELLVTDENTMDGNVIFIDLRSDTIVGIAKPGRALGEKEAPGRNPYRVCHHPVFNGDGTKVLANSLSSEHAAVCEVEVPVLR